MELGYSNEINRLLRELIDEAAPRYRRLDGSYDRMALTTDTLDTLRIDYPERYEEFAQTSDLKSIFDKVNSRLSSAKTGMSDGSDSAAPVQTRLNLNIPVPGRRDGDVKSIYECRLREVMLDAMKREEQIAANQAALREERAVIKYMLEAGASMDDYVKDYFKQAA